MAFNELRALSLYSASVLSVGRNANAKPHRQVRVPVIYPADPALRELVRDHDHGPPPRPGIMDIAGFGHWPHFVPLRRGTLGLRVLAEHVAARVVLHKPVDFLVYARDPEPFRIYQANRL